MSENNFKVGWVYENRQQCEDELQRIVCYFETEIEALIKRSVETRPLSLRQEWGRNDLNTQCNKLERIRQCLYTSTGPIGLSMVDKLEKIRKIIDE